jgi:hypothetical protein
MYVARYGLRNLWLLLFDPGYAHSTQHDRFHRIGLQFLPITGGVVGAATRTARGELLSASRPFDKNSKNDG